jgi:hypothetical protein
MTAVELELAELKTRIERLETTVHQLTGSKQQVTPPPPGAPLDPEQLLAWLRAEGVVRAPTGEECRLAAEWDALSEGERQAIRWELDHLPPGPMASDIVVENRR